MVGHGGAGPPACLIHPMLPRFLIVLLSLAQAAVFDGAGNKIRDGEVIRSKPAWRDFNSNNPEKLSGVGVLGAPWVGDVCTATLLDTGSASGPAYILTNAHCNFFAHWGLDFLRPDEVRTHRWTGYSVTFHHYMDLPASQRKSFSLKEITYITESRTDLAIYELNASLEELAKQGIRPVRVSKTRPAQGDRVKLIGVPLLYVAADQKSLHISDCALLEVASLKNGSYEAPESVRHQCASLPGFSGGPLLSSKGEIVLLNSHGSDDEAGDADCTYETRPCERVGGELVVRPELNYGQYVDRLPTCFHDGKFDLSLKACGLPKAN